MCFKGNLSLVARARANEYFELGRESQTREVKFIFEAKSLQDTLLTLEALQEMAAFERSLFTLRQDVTSDVADGDAAATLQGGDRGDVYFYQVC